MEKASKQNIITTINDITISNTTTIATTSVTIADINAAVATVANSTCVSSVLHQSGTAIKKIKHVRTSIMCTHHVYSYSTAHFKLDICMHVLVELLKNLEKETVSFTQVHGMSMEFTPPGK